MSQKLRLIGDVHGEFGRYETILRNTSYPSIQVGDMGLGFGKEPPTEQMITGNHRFLRGNHDNPAPCKIHPQYMPDGTVEIIGDKKFMFIGGALSIDREWRIEGVSWWPDEELSYAELQAMIILYEKEKPDVMVTHECPETIANQLFGTENYASKDGKIIVDESGEPVKIKKLSIEFSSRTRQALQAMYEIHQPEFHYFGHWHSSRDETIGRTRFVCLAELETVDIEI